MCLDMEQLDMELREVSMVLADEVHRSHADKTFTEEMGRVLGGPVPLRMYTGTRLTSNSQLVQPPLLLCCLRVHGGVTCATSNAII